MHRCVRGGHLARQRQHESNGQLGHSNRVCARRVHHHDAAPRGGIGVDVVHAHPGATDHAQLGRMLHQRVVHLYGTAHHQRVGIGKGRRQTIRQLVVRQDFPSRLGRKHRQRRRRNLLRQNDFHLLSLVLFRSGILVKTYALLFAQQIEHAHHGRMRFALAPLVVGDGVGMDAQPLRHLVLIEVELLARNQQLFSECSFRHECPKVVSE